MRTRALPASPALALCSFCLLIDPTSERIRLLTERNFASNILTLA